MIRNDNLQKLVSVRKAFLINLQVNQYFKHCDSRGASEVDDWPANCSGAARFHGRGLAPVQLANSTILDLPIY